MTSTYGELRDQLATLTTEAFRPELADIDRLPTSEIARIMNDEDATVPAAVAARRPADLRRRRHGGPARRPGRQ
jgi:N-acetylmuramic acid 6-phosphate etherase